MTRDDNGEEREDPAKVAKFYLSLIKDIVGGGIASGGSRYSDRDRMPTALGGPNTAEANERRLLAMYALAKDVLRRLGSYRPPAMPDRPAMLPVSDLTIMTHQIAVRQRGERASAMDREVVSAFGLWRTELVSAEGESGNRLRVLMRAHDSLLAVAARGAGEDDATIANLEAHIAGHWNVEAPYPPEAERDRMIAHACRRTDLLSTWLMNGDRPPRSFASVRGGGGGYGGGRGGSRPFDPRGNMGATEDDELG